MDFGLYFSLQLPRPWREGAERALFEEALEQVELGDRLGIGYAWVAEQHFLEEYSHSSAPEVFLAAASQRTREIRLGHGVVLMPPGYNAPARVAERIATLDLVSGGRVEFGVGDSKSRMELDGFGINPGERQAMTAEAVEQVADMLALDPYPGFTGRWFAMPARNVVPKPVQRPHPPLWMACSSDAAVRTAARRGMGALVHSFFDAGEARRVVRDYHETFERECVPIGHSVNRRVATLEPFYCHPDAEQARSRGLEAMGFLTFAVRHYYTFGRHRPGRTNIWENATSVKERLGADVPLRGGHCVGTPEQIAEHLRDLRDAGVDQVILLHQAGRITHDEICASLRIFADEVVGEFTAGDPGRVRLGTVAPRIAATLEQRRAAVPADEDIPTCDAYGRDRSPPDLAAQPQHVRAQLAELERMAELARRLEP